MFVANHIVFTQMSKRKATDYMKQWFRHFVPPEKQAEAYPRCFSGRISKLEAAEKFQRAAPSGKRAKPHNYSYLMRKYTAYLWHACGSYTPCGSKEQARQAYMAQLREKCVVLMNCERLAFIVDDASALTADIADKFNDILITDIKFRWTYVHTHEKYCGPYFAERPPNGQII